MAVKILGFLVVVGFVLWVFEYVPKHLNPGRNAKFRYRIFAVVALIAAAVLLKKVL
jgi:hypothetical protein